MSVIFITVLHVLFAEKNFIVVQK